MPDFEPVYVRTKVEAISEASVKVTLFVQLRNLQQPREPYHGGVDVRWEHVLQEETGIQARLHGILGQGSGTQMAPDPLFPDTATETVMYSGQSTLYLENSWLIDRDDWEASDGFGHPFMFTIEVDPEPYGDNFARPARLLPLEAKALVAAIDLLGEHLPHQPHGLLGPPQFVIGARFLV